MAITIDGTTWRNLEEQVEWNKTKILEHYARDRVLADFGIRIIGTVQYTSQIPGFIDGTYGGQEYGDAYLISPTLSPPWDTLVWTRRTAGSTVEDGIWIDLGDLAIPGPQGIQGEEGPRGPQGDASEWYASQTDALPVGDFTVGDMAVIKGGGVYRYNGSTWIYQMSILGPQGQRGPTGPIGPEGPEGPIGPAGPVGRPASAIRLLGTLSGVEYLPDPGSLSQDDGVPAYLVTIGTEIRMYYVQGTVGEETWGYVVFNAPGTVVTVGGSAVAAFNSDTKVDKTTSPYRVYATDDTGSAILVPWTSGIQYGKAIPRCDTTGHQHVLEPTEPDHPATKMYVDTAGGEKVDKVSASKRIYGTDDSGNQKILYYTDNPGGGGGSVVTRGGGGQILVPLTPGTDIGTAYADMCATSKKYVDDSLAALHPSSVTKIVTFQGPMGGNLVISISDLPGIIPNTKIDLVASISQTGITQLPAATLAVGGNSINNSTRWTVPPITPEATRWAGTFFSNGSVFFVLANDTSTPSAISGGDITIGVTGDGGGLTTATITYLSTP
jgi:hypothetical protein